jgi:hypothetical protein
LNAFLNDFYKYTKNVFIKLIYTLIKIKFKMASVIFGNTLDMLNVTVPPGGYIVAYDLDGVLKQKDEFGVITPVGGGPINISGTGSTNFIPRWNSIHELSSTSSIYDDGSGVVFSSLIEPSQNDVYDIGSTSSRWKDLYLGSKIDILTNLEIEKAGDTIAEFNDNGLVLKQDKYLQLIGGQIFPKDIIAAFIYYPYILKVGSRIFVSDYGTNIYEYDEDLTFVQTFNFPDGAFGLQYNPLLNRIYVGDYNGGVTTRYIDLNTDTIVTGTATGEYSREVLTFNSFSNRIYAVSYYTEPNELSFYDENYDEIGSIILPATVSGQDSVAWGITSNSINGKVYVTATAQGVDAAIWIYEPTISGVNLIETIIYPDEGFNIYNTFGSDFDADRNRAYVGINDFIAVIDGDNDTTITTIDLSSYGNGIKSIRYFDNRIIVGITSFSNIGFILDINPDTYNISIVDESSRIFFYYNSGIFDGTHYYYINEDNLTKANINKIDVNSIVRSVDLSQNNDDVIHELQAKSGTIAHLEDITTLTGRTVWVDSTYGNNTTAEKYNFIKPYLTLVAAMTAAVSGDTIVVRPGSYAMGTLTLKDGVNIHMINGVNITSGSFTDNSVVVNCKITGNMDIASTSNNVFSITGNGSNVIIECDKYTFNGGGNSMNIQNQCTFQFKCKQYITRGGIAFQGGANAIIDIDDVLMAPDSFNQTRRFTDFRGSFSGNVIINFKKLTFGDNGSGFQWLTHLDTIGEGARITLNGEEVISTNQTESPNEWSNALIAPQSGYASSNAILTYRIKRIRTEARQLYVSLREGNSGTTIILEDINFKRNRTTTNFKGTIRHSRSYDRVIFKNCKISVGSEGEDDNHIVVVGSPTTFNIPGIFAGQVDYLNMEFINCQFIKESLGTDTTALFLLDGENSNISIKNCDIVLSGTFSSPVPHAFDADALLEGNVYFKNTISNIDNSPNIADTALVSGFIGNDTNLTIL